MTRFTCKGLQFYTRPGTSDKKTILEVVQRQAYFRYGMKVNAGEEWYDCGANIGAFTVLAASKGAEVTAFEPDPLSCEVLESNLKLNKLKAKIVNAALVHDNTKTALLHIGAHGDVWRNSLWKKWQGSDTAIKVKCVNFDTVIPNGARVKMDIEGAEIPILENTRRKFKVLVFEWSFDIDRSLPRLWNVLERLQAHHSIRMPKNGARFLTRDYDTWQTAWYPRLLLVWAYGKN
jgi:FkbM family methyltransferase